MPSKPIRAGTTEDRGWRWRRLPWLAPALILLAGLGGCDQEEARLARRPVALTEIPAPVLDAAKKALPEVNFNEAWRNVDESDSTRSYEIRGQMANGKIREVRVAPTGEIQEME